MGVVFQKMHGAGNDFVLLDLRAQSLEMDADKAIALANRRTGIGCDQVLVLREPSEPGHIVDFEVWNADGSRAEQCGNGVRCIGLYLQASAAIPPGTFSIGGPVAELRIECLADGQVRVDMGEPVFDPAEIAVTGTATDGWYDIRLGKEILRLGAVSMGNPHALMLVEDIQDPRIPELGPLIARHERFPQGCNAGFAEIQDRENIRLRVFERGAGETLSCGSGASAAVAILNRTGLVGDHVLVKQSGGTLIIAWRGSGHPLMLTGPARHVFEGDMK